MAGNKVYTAIGMMSGTSMDGIDVALVRTDGKDMTELLDSRLFPYEEATRNAVRGVLGSRHATPETAQAERLLTDAHIQAVKQFGHKADIIGFHGQTIMHDPSQKFTWQIGDSARLAMETGMDVIGDMRQADVKAGGQGAPLLPLCHRSFAADVEKPIAILNLGGVANITWLGRERTDILAFDTGPANALIDDLVNEATDEPYDHDGKLAQAGTPDVAMVARWLSHPYFSKPAPKSLDRDEWDVAEVRNLKLEDAVATLALFTVESVIKSLDLLPDTPRALYVAGGGRHNNYMMGSLNAALDYTVEPVEALGWNGDMLEAQGFAYLAVRSLLGLALTLPTTTGIKEPMTGGKLYKAQPDHKNKIIVGI
ncbi:MAG TPA: anhydro-N-acetylmuramic acid kinase [Alphaproteobacteria bacterium]|nr:anhydro-N-acetylmuramic acid kinase [Alphaproteobacteria bacterium]